MSKYKKDEDCWNRLMPRWLRPAETGNRSDSRWSVEGRRTQISLDVHVKHGNLWIMKIPGHVIFPLQRLIKILPKIHSVTQNERRI